MADIVIWIRKHLKLIDGLSVLVFTISFIVNAKIINLIFGDSALISLGDYGRNVQASSQVLSTLSYPKFFLYPPFYAILVSLIASVGLKVGYVIWIGLLFCATLGSLLGVQKLLGRQGQPGFFTATLIGLFAVGSFVNWDFRAVNGNTIYLAMIIWSLILYRSGHTPLAGIALAASIGIKLYSVVFLPWLFWTGQWRWLLWTLVGLAVVFVGVPLLWLGSDSFALTRSWLDAVFSAGGSANQEWANREIIPAYIISVHATVAALLRGSFTDEIVILVTRSIQGIWIILIAAYFLFSWRGKNDARTSIAADSGVLVIVPLLLSPAIQPHHGAVMLLPASMMAIIAAEPDNPKWLRFTLAGILLASFTVVRFGPRGDLRGVALISAAILMLAGMALVRASSDYFFARSIDGYDDGKAELVKSTKKIVEG